MIFISTKIICQFSAVMIQFFGDFGSEKIHSKIFNNFIEISIEFCNGQPIVSRISFFDVFKKRHKNLSNPETNHFIIKFLMMSKKPFWRLILRLEWAFRAFLPLAVHRDPHFLSREKKKSRNPFFGFCRKKSSY